MLAYQTRGQLESYQRGKFGAQQPLAVTYAASITPDASQSSLQTCLMTGAITVVGPTNPLAVGDSFTFILTQGGAGSYATSWGSGIKNGPTVTAGAAGTRALFSFHWDGAHWQYLGPTAITFT